MALSQRFLFAILILISVIFIICTYLVVVSPILSFAFGILALFFDLIAFSTKYYTPFFVPFLKMKQRNVVLNAEEPFLMSPSGNTLLVRREGDILASAFIRIPTYRSSTEMSEDERAEFSRLFSRALTITKYPIKFGAQLYVINKDAYINNIVNKLNESEEKYQNEMVNKSATKTQSDRVRGEVTMWHNLFDNVNKVKSQSLEAFAMTTAVGTTEEEASNLALQQADELAAGISAIFGITATIIEGEDILKFVEPDYMIPLVTISEQMRERTMSG